MRLNYVGAYAVLWVSLLVSVAQSQLTPSQPTPESAVNVDSIRARAEAGDEIAQRQMGDLSLMGGYGVPRDVTAAAAWYEKAAAQKSAFAMGNLATLYFYGEGVPRDLAKAQELASASAWAGWHQGQFVMQMLCAMPESGIAHQVDFVTWGMIAANQGNQEAFVLLTQLDEQLTFDQIQAGQSLSASFKSKPIEGSKDVEGDQPRLDWSFSPHMQATKGGSQYYTFAKSWRQVSGRGLVRDTAAALMQLKAQANQGFVPSQMALSILYFDGIDLPADSVESFKWLKLCAEQGEPQCEAEISSRYELGVGIPQKDTVEALRWRILAATHGDAVSQNLLGTWFAVGKNTARDWVTAYSWLSLAAQAGDTVSSRQAQELAQKMTAEEIQAGKKQTERLSTQVGNRPKQK